MKMRQTFLKLMLAALTAAPASAAQRLALQPESRLWIEGDSTLHTFSSTATVLDIQAVLAQDPPSALQRGGLTALTVKVPVAKMESGEKGLDKNMRNALKADANPDISFELSGYEVEPGAEGGAVAKAAGFLTIAGARKETAVEGRVELTPAGLRVRGGKTFLMSEYGVKPPTLMMGMIKVKDQVSVKFDLLFKAAAEPQAK